MLDNYLRSTKDYLLAAIANQIQSTHPIIITWLALAVGLLGAGFLSIQRYDLGLAFWLGNRLLDGLDGAVARLRHKQSDLGGYLDIVFDFVVYALVPIALVVSQPSMAAYLSLAFLLATFYINGASWMYLAAILEKRAHGAGHRGELTSVTMPAGLIGGAETIIFYCLFIIWPQQLVMLFTIMAVLVLITTAQRLLWAARTLT